MLLPIESIYDGSWGGGPWPAELVIAEVLLETGWTWSEWQATPMYLQRVMWDVIQARRKAKADADEKARREAEANRAAGR